MHTVTEQFDQEPSYTYNFISIWKIIEFGIKLDHSLQKNSNANVPYKLLTYRNGTPSAPIDVVERQYNSFRFQQNGCEWFLQELKNKSTLFCAGNKYWKW